MISARHVLFSCTMLAGALLAPGPASAQTLGNLVKISGGTPFGKCTADQVGSQPGTNYPGSAIEPWIAVDPTTAGHLLTGVQQDRWSNGGSRGLRAGVSVDGGRHWKTSIPQGVSLCTGGRLQRSTDPWTGIGLDGTAYFFSLAFNNNPSPPINGESAQLVSRSTDGGVTWSAPYAVIDDTDPLAFNDKNSLTTDPTIPGNVYTVWDRLYGPPTAFRFPFGSDEHGNGDAAAAVPRDGLLLARERIGAQRAAAAKGQAVSPNDYFGPTYFARSTDSGQTWSRATPIYDPGKGAQTIANLIVGEPTGELLDFFTHIDSHGNTSIASVHSLDHGFSWTNTPVLVTPTIPVGAVTPDSQVALRDASLLFSPTVNPLNGHLYVVWEQPDGTPALASILFTESTDHGKTWSTPVKINKTPANSVNPLRGQAFDPTVVAAPDGTLVVTYYDFRNDVGPAGTELADAWVLFCSASKSTTEPCTKPARWGREMRLTDQSFNITQAPVDGGYFLGDYFGLVAQGHTVWPAFTAVTGPGQTALYTRGIHLGETVAAR